GEEKMGVRGGATAEASGKFFETLGGGFDRESNTTMLMGPRVTDREEKDVEMEGIFIKIEEILGDRSVRDEKMEE
ncbi:hypothetical protein KI387_028742, partial [Taxus chinensis]